MIDDNQLIAPRPDVDYRNLSAQPSPEEFFLLSRVTGVVSVKQLCTTSGLGRDKTLAAIERLIGFGLLEAVDEAGNAVDLGIGRAGGGGESLAGQSSTGGADASETSSTPDSSTPSQPASAQPVGVDAIPVEPAPESEPDVVPPGAGRTDNRTEPGPPSVDIFGESPEPTPPAGPGSPNLEGAPLSEADEDDLFDIPPATAHAATVEEDDDDLFMPSSPAHISRVESAEGADRKRSKTIPGPPNRQEPTSRPAASTPEPARTPQPRDAGGGKSSDTEERYPLFPGSLDEFEVDESVLEEGVDPELQREILFVHSQLDQIDFYQLFGVERDANRRTIKRSYFKLSKRFHPDQFFRDEAGGVAGRVEEIFKFVTKAYNTLSKKKKRAEYDQALQEQAAEADRSAEDERRKREMAADLLARRAQQLEEQGDFVGAAGELRKVASLRRDPQLLLRAANLLLRANQKLDEAASYARAARREMTGSVEPYLLLGQIYEKNEMFAEALDAFEQANQIAPGDPSVQIHLERIRSQS